MSRCRTTEAKELDLSSVPDLGEMGVYRDLLEQWLETGEGQTIYGLKRVRRRYEAERSGGSIKKYVNRLKERNLAVPSNVYEPKPVIAPLPGPPLLRRDYRIMQRISNFTWRMRDRITFGAEVLKHRTLKCINPNCGHIIRSAVLPRRPCPKCLSPMVLIYNRVFKESP